MVCCCELLFVVVCRLSLVARSSSFVRLFVCLLFVVRCLWFVVCCLSFAVSCLVLAVSC